MGLDLRIAHSVEEVGRSAWDYLGQHYPLAGYRWYRFGEAVLADERPVYILLSYRDEPVGRATFWVKRREPLPIPSAVVRRPIEALIRCRPLFVCRSPLTSLSGLILPKPPLRDEGLRLIAAAALQEARRYRASFVLFDYLEDKEACLPIWPAGFAPTTIADPGTCLYISWSSFEEYLAHLPKSVRKDYRRHRNRAADQAIQVTCHPLTEPLAPEVIDRALTLIHNVDRHHRSPSHPWGREMLEKAYLVDATWITAFIGERMVGCGLLLGDGEVRFLALLGLDYEVQYVYFQLFYAAIKHAIEGGVRMLRGGSGAYEMKLRLGFQLEGNNYAVFSGIGTPLHKLGQWAARTTQHATRTTHHAVRSTHHTSLDEHLGRGTGTEESLSDG
ncbi:MAG: GNAT family N-acetyltransferase [Anaerolineae bacterium]|nr:GNAT family N-acetyltransferase [Anaerolineae bacterium]